MAYNYLYPYNNYQYFTNTLIGFRGQIGFHLESGNYKVPTDVDVLPVPESSASSTTNAVYVSSAIDERGIDVADGRKFYVGNNQPSGYDEYVCRGPESSAPFSYVFKLGSFNSFVDIPSTTAYTLTKVVFAVDSSHLPTGYKFHGWFCGEATNAATPARGTLWTTATITVDGYKLQASGYKKYIIIPLMIKKQVYTITWDGNGGTPSSQTTTIYEGDSLGTLPTVTRDNCNFVGWYTSNTTSGTAVTASTVPRGSTTYYARWAYKITWNANGGTPASQVSYVEQFQKITTLPSQPTRAGYTFIKWYTTSTGTGGYEVTVDTIPTAPSIYYAIWQGNYVIVLFNPNGASLNPESESTRMVEYGKTYGVKVGASSATAFPTTTGYDSSQGTLLGWYTTPVSGGSKIEESTTVAVTNTYIVLYARIQVKVTYDYLMETVPSGYPSQIAGNVGAAYSTGSNVGASGTGLTTPSWTYHTFQGWFTAPTGGTQVTNSSVFTIGIFKIYAHWSSITYTVAYTLNSGTAGTFAPTSAVVGEAFCVSNPTRANYTFTGWKVTSGLNTSTAKYGNSTSQTTAISSSSVLCYVNASSEVWFLNIRNNAGSVTLAAQWTANEYTLIVNDNKPSGSVHVMPEKLKYGTTTYNNISGVLATRNGYTRAGYWDTSAASGGTQVYNSSGQNVQSTQYWTAAYSSGTFRGTSNLTVYARWTANYYDIGYDNLFHYARWARSSSCGLTSQAGGATLEYTSVTSSAFISGTADIKITSGTTANIYTKFGNSSDYCNVAVSGSTSYTIYCTFAGTSTYSQVYYVELKSDYSYVKASSPYYTATTISGGEGTRSATITTSSTCAYLQFFFDVHDTGKYMIFRDFRVCKTSPFSSVTVSTPRKAYTYDDTGATSIGTLITPTRSGYNFVGWYTAETGGTLITNTTPISVVGFNRNLYSRWDQNTRTITFHANGGTGTMAAQTVAYNTATALSSNAFTFTNNDFVGWSLEPTGRVNYKNGASITATTNIDLYAVWRPQFCYAFFNANGGTLPSYSDGGTEAGGSRTRADNLRICRKGDRISHNINIYSMKDFRYIAGTAYLQLVGDTVEIDNSASSSATSYIGWYPYELNIPSEANYTLVFEAVSIDSTYNKFSRFLVAETNLNSSYQSQFENTYWSISSPSAGPLLAYATGRALEAESTTAPTKLRYFTLANVATPAGQRGKGVFRSAVFAGCGISNFATNQYGLPKYSYVSPFTGYIVCPLPTPTRSGYTFAGWYANAGGTGTRYTGDSTITSSVTLYAKWTQNTQNYTITFNANGGSGSMSQVTAAAQSTVTLPNNSFTYTNFTFIGWATSATGDIIYANGASFTITGNLNLYAIWQRNICIVRFNANGGTLPSFTDTGAESGGARSRADNMRFIPAGKSCVTNANVFPSNNPNAFFSKGAGITLSQNKFTCHNSATSQSIIYMSWRASKLNWFPEDGTVTCIVEIISTSANSPSRLLTSLSYTTSGGTNIQNQIQDTFWYVSNVAANDVYLAYADAKPIDTSISGTLSEGFAFVNVAVPAGATVNLEARFSVFAGSVVAAGTALSGQTKYSYKAPYNDGLLCAMPTPTRSGFDFLGWYDNAMCSGSQYLPYTIITANKTLYAKWRYKEVLLTFTGDQGVNKIYYAVPTNLFDIEAWSDNPNSFTTTVAAPDATLSCDRALNTIRLQTYNTARTVSTGGSTNQGSAATYYSITVEANTQYDLNWGWTSSRSDASIKLYYFTNNTSTGTYIQQSNLTGSGTSGQQTSTFTTPSNCTAVVIVFSMPTSNIGYIEYKNVSIIKKAITYNTISNDPNSPFKISVTPGSYYYSYCTAYSGYTPVLTPQNGLVSAAATVAYTTTGATYTLTINPNGGSYSGTTSSSTKSLVLGTAYPDSIGKAQRSGYYFNGWYATISGQEVMIFNRTGAPVPETQCFDINYKWIYAGNLTVVAKWSQRYPIYIFSPLRENSAIFSG